MKKVFNSLFVIIAAMVTFAGCAKQEIDAPATPETKTVQFFANSIETKTAFGTPDGTSYPTLWTKDDRVKVFVNLNAVKDIKTEAVVTVNPSEDLTSATFKSTEIQDPGTQDYTFYAVSPSDAYQTNSRNSETNTFTVLIPQTQIPTDTSVDSDAQVIYAVSENYVQQEMPTSVDLDFKHFSAYCKLSFSELSEELGNITQVTLESDVDLAGKWNVNLGEGEHTAVDGSKKIIITTGKSENIWIACAPADLSGKKIKFIIDAEDGSSVSREVTFPNDKKYQFKSGVIASLTIKMDQGVLVKPTVDKYFEKVTSAPSDWTGTYLIVYEGGNVAFDGNLAKLDDASNTIPVTITDEEIVYTETLMKSTFAIAKNGDSYSIKSASGKYIGNNSDSNSLTSSNSALNNSLSFKSENEIDVISSGGAYLRYNATSGQNRFRYFKSGTYTNQKAIQLYKLVGDESEGGEGGGNEGGETPVEPEQLTMSDITCSAKTDNSLTFTWTAVANANGYEVSCNGKTETVSNSTSTITYTVTGLTASTEYTISIKACGDGTNYSDSEPKTQKGTTAAQSGDPTGGYTLITDVSEITSGTYVIAAKVNNNYYAMSKTFASKINGTQISVTNNTIAESAATNYVVTITKSGDSYTIKSGSNYLKYSSSTNLGTQTSVYNWKIAKGTKGTFRFTSATSGRGLVFRAGTYNQFGGYALSNVTANGTEYYDVELFKLN